MMIKWRSQSTVVLSACLVSLSAVAASALQEKIAASAEQQWVFVSTNRFQDAWPDPLQYSFEGDPMPWVRGNPSSVIKAWSSFAWDTKRDRLILWGGGHANYAGNEVYLWNGDNGAWTRGSLPNEIQRVYGGEVGVEVYDHIAIDGADNAPQSAHTYDNNIYLPLADRFLTFGGAPYSAGGGHFHDINLDHTGPYFWDPAKADPNKVGGTTGSQVRPDEFPDVLGGGMWENRHNPIPYDRGHIESATAYAVEDGKEVIYVDTAIGLFKYTVTDPFDAARDTWERVGDAYRPLGGNWSQGPGALDAEEGLYVRIGGRAGDGSNRFYYYDFADYAPDILALAMVFEPVVLGSFDFDTDLRDAGMDYDPVRDRFVIWDVKGRLWALASPQTTLSGHWELSLIDALESAEGFPNPSEPGSVGAGTGILGKWEYAPDLDIFLGLYDPYGGGVWAYKPENWSPASTNPEPDPNPEPEPEPEPDPNPEPEPEPNPEPDPNPNPNPYPDPDPIPNPNPAPNPGNTPDMPWLLPVLKLILEE